MAREAAGQEYRVLPPDPHRTRLAYWTTPPTSREPTAASADLTATLADPAREQARRTAGRRRQLGRMLHRMVLQTGRFVRPSQPGRSLSRSPNANIVSLTASTLPISCAPVSMLYGNRISPAPASTIAALSTSPYRISLRLILHNRPSTYRWDPRLKAFADGSHAAPLSQPGHRLLGHHVTCATDASNSSTI